MLLDHPAGIRLQNAICRYQSRSQARSPACVLTTRPHPRGAALFYCILRRRDGMSS